MTNVIQNYVNNINQSITNVNNTTKKYYDNLTDVDAENLLAPLDGKGYLVENNLLTAPREFAKDSYYTAKALTKGVSGKANDHELGKLNDLGLKLGGLAIATYLMTKRQTPKEKAMEFIGFGAFLASMSVWPKVALQWPAQLIHGVNFRKQYVDEQGRKKYLTQDPNYIPFDLMKGKHKTDDLDAIADRMGIAKDVKDRKDLAKEHVRKVSVQNNTLWMLTAGIATPIMTAISCNLVEKPLGKFFEKVSNNNANNLAYKINSYINNRSDNTLEKELIDSKLDKTAENKLKAILDSKTGKAITSKEITQLSEALTYGLDTKTQKAARLDLETMLKIDKTVVNEDTIEKITNVLTERLDTHYGEGFTASILDSKKIGQHITNFMTSQGNPENNILTVEQTDSLRNSLADFVNGEIINNKELAESRIELVNSTAFNVFDEVLSKSKATVLSKEAVDDITNAGKIIRRFRAFDETISSATHFKVEEASETVAGNNWGDVTDVLIKELKISSKELAEAKSSEELTTKLFIRKLEEVAKDDQRYNKLVKNISQKMAELDVKLDNPESGKAPVMDTLVSAIEKNCEDTAEQLNNITGTNRKSPFKNLSRRISCEEVNGARTGSLRESKVRRIKNIRIGGIQNAYMRLLHTVDFFRRAEEYNPDKNMLAGFSGDKALDNELISRGKKLLISSHSGDFFMKNQTGNNVDFYRALMWHTFAADGMTQATKDALPASTHQVFHNGNISMAQRVRDWAKHIHKLMGNSKYDFLFDHMLENPDELSNVEKTPIEKFNKVACSPENLLHNALKQKYNSNKWMKIFGTIGATVFAATVAAQFTFGGHDNINKQA